MSDRGPLWKRKDLAWLLFLAFWAEIAFAVVNLSSMPLYLAKDLNFGAFTATLVLTAFFSSEAVFKAMGGKFADRFGHSRLLSWALIVPVVTCTCTLLPPFRNGFAMTALRVADGLAAALLWPALYAHFGASAPPGRRSEAMSLLNTAYLAGIAVAFVAGGIMDDLLGPLLAKTTGLYSGGILLGACLFGLLFLTALRLPKNPPVEHEDEPATEFKTGGLPIVFLVLAAITYMAVGLPSTVIKLIAMDAYGLSSGAFGLMALPMTLILAVLSIASTRWVEQIGRARCVRGGLLFACLGLTVLSLGIVFPVLRSLWVAALATIPIGLGFVFALPAWMAVVVDHDRERRATNLGVVMTAQGIGAMVGVPLGGWLFDNGPHLTGLKSGLLLPVGMAAVCLAVAFVLSFVAVRPKPYLKR